MSREMKTLSKPAIGGMAISCEYIRRDLLEETTSISGMALFANSSVSQPAINWKYVRG